MTEDAKYPFFHDDIQFWYETKRAFGVSSYGASEFGEVMWSWEVDTAFSPGLHFARTDRSDRELQQKGPRRRASRRRKGRQ